MTLTHEVALQTSAVLDQAETDIDRMMGSGEPEQVAAAYRFLLRLLVNSSSRLKVGIVLDQFDAMSSCRPKRCSALDIRGHKRPMSISMPIRV